MAFNGEYGVDLKERLQTELPAGQYCDVVSGRARPEGGGCTGKTVVVGDDGAAYVEILKDEQEGVLAIHARVGVSLKLFSSRLFSSLLPSFLPSFLRGFDAAESKTPRFFHLPRSHAAQLRGSN